MIGKTEPLEQWGNLFQLNIIQDIIYNKIDTLFILRLDNNHQILEANQSFLHLIGKSAIKEGTHWYELFRSLEEEEYTEESVIDFSLGHIFRLMGDQRLVRIFSIDTGRGTYLVGEKVSFARDEALEVMSRLTNKISSVYRELAKKNMMLERSNIMINDLMRTDPLTNLANRRHMMEYLCRHVKLAARHGTPLSLIIADIDDFKRVNDTYGHLIGDKVICRLAVVLQEGSREEDLPSRFGGEEFCIILPHTVAAEAYECSERIRMKLHSQRIPTVHSPVSASFGVAEFKEEDDCESLINKADLALYKAKREGKNRTCLFDESPES